jgi:eukaryotic-like serine/threonine-protein kinase
MSEIFRFGRFRFDADRLELRADGAPLKVEPRPLAVLAELLRHAGELVTKAELMDNVWTGRVLSESVITRCINRLRLALDDEDQSLILTVHGFGYRFTGPVLREDSKDVPATPVRLQSVLRAGETPPFRPGWRLERALDEGRVWLAVNEITGQRRVFKYGFDPRELAALRREALLHRILLMGLGKHANIAHVLDANLVGPPFFIELEYCPEGNLGHWLEAQGGAACVPLALRVELMAEAAETLAAAHALGVLHLDIKPSNLLVWIDDDRKPRIRVSDFGSGRLTAPQRLIELGITPAGATGTLTAHLGRLQGTVNYIAPEILRGETPTVAADIYALGVMLYQILVGDLHRPIAAGWERNVPDELLRQDVAASANDTPEARLPSAIELARRLRLLEERRTAAAEFSRRALEQEALARRVERARARRPWLIALIVVLAVGLGLSFRNYREAVRARDEARVQTQIADAVVAFLDRDILSEGSPFSVAENSGNRPTVRDAVDRAAAHLEGRFAAQPRIEAAIRATIGQVYVEDGDYEAAEGQIRRAVELAKTSGGEADDRTLQAEYSLAFALTVNQKFDEARSLLESANSALARHPDADPETRLRGDVINGNYWFARQDFRRAALFFERTLSATLQHGVGDISKVAIRQTSLAWCYATMGQFDKARVLYADALAAVHRAEPTPGTLTGTIEERYGIGLFLAGRNDEARAMLGDAHRHLKAAIGDDGLTAEALTYLGWLDLREGRRVQALSELEEAYREERASAGATHRMTLRARACLGLAQIANGHPTEGMNDVGAAVRDYQRVLGLDAPEAQVFLFLWIESALDLGNRLPVDASSLGMLNRDTLSLGAPWEKWDERLGLLERRLRAVGGDKT